MSSIASPGNVDAAFEELSPLGRYNLVQYVVLLLAIWPIPMNYFSVVFQGQSNSFHCSQIYTTNRTSVAYETNSSFSSTCGLPSNEYESNSTATNGSCDAFDVEYLLPKDRSFVSDFDLVCDRAYLAGFSTMMITLGNLIGAFFFPYFSDRYGRKPVIVVTYSLAAMSSLGLALSINFEMLVVFKFLLGFFLQGSEAPTVSAIAETFVKRHRAIFFAFGGGTNWAVASLALGPIAYMLQNYSWKVQQFAISAFSIHIIVILLIFDETLRWLSANGRRDRVRAVLKRAAKWNGRNLEQVITAYNTPTDDHSGTDMNDIVNSNKPDLESFQPLTTTQDHSTNEERLTMKHLFTDPMLRRHMLFNMVAWFFNSLIYFALTLMSSELHGSIYINYSLSIIIEIPACIYCLYFLDKFGRRWSFLFLSLVTGVALIAVALAWEFAPDQGILIIILTCIGKFGVTGSYTVIYMYTPELFPTNLRNVGMGVGYFCARIGGMLSPFAELLQKHAAYGPGLVFGVSSLILSVGSLFLPETTDKELPQTLAEMKNWDKKKTRK